MTTSHTLADALIAECVRVTESFFDRHAPDDRLPRVFAGHAVGADVRADIVFTLGHLAASGVIDLGGRSIDDLIVRLLGEVDGVATHSFFSYRIAETLLDRGPFAGNPLLVPLDDRQRAQVETACDSSSFVTLLDQGRLPRNYAAVLSRCEQARLALGLVDTPETLDGLLARLRALLTENPRHALDDSNDGAGRFDIYTADIWLFCEPLADAIGAEWRAGLGDALALVEDAGGPDGSAIPWGRSTGVLAIALTVELAAAALHHQLGDDPRRWLRRGADAAEAMRGWFGDDGVVNAHQHRDQDRYRGPARRLQLTFDLLGKLAFAARILRHLDDTVSTASRPATYPSIDRLHIFDDRSNARLWTFRRPGLAFAIPFVGAARSHYLPAPVRPGCFEVPVDQDLPTWSPLVVANYQRYTAGGIPDSITHEPGTLDATWSGFVATTDTFATERPAPLGGVRHARFTIEGRTLTLDDTLTFDSVPQAVAIAIPELPSRPLIVEFSFAERRVPSPRPKLAPASDASLSEHDDYSTRPLNGRSGSVIDVDGIAEWQTAWSSVARVHQLDLEPARQIRYRVRVTPKLRVGSTAHGHHYDRSLSRPMRDRAVDLPSPIGWEHAGTTTLDDIDVLHLHWPEWLAFDDLAEHHRLADLLADRGIPVVWTAHNLTPHSKEPERFDPVYSMWAHRATTVIHHSEWGRRRMLDRYEFPDVVEHVVVRHGHFGRLWNRHLVTRDHADAALGLAPCAFRIGIVGAPRAEKRVREFAEGFVASGRDDLQLAVWSLAPGESLPDDPRITIAETYRNVDAATYALRLSACDAIALPFDPDGEMLATGTVADAIGLGMPVLASNWGFLAEYLGDAAIDIGDASVGAVRDAIETLDATHFEVARAAMAAIRPEFEWAPIADQTFTALEAAVLRAPTG